MLAVFTLKPFFHTGWFIESMAMQVLVVFIILTRRNPLQIRPNPWLTICSLSDVKIAVSFPHTRPGSDFGFAPMLLLF